MATGDYQRPQQLQQYALVSMTNKDVYYVSVAVGQDILRKLTRGDDLSFIETVDTRSGANVGIAVHHVSSVVVKGGRDA